MNSTTALLLVIACTLSVPSHAQQPPPLASLSATRQSITSCWRDARPRTKHGFPGITPEQCSDAGSCYDSTYADQPWCFFPNATPTTWESPGPVQRYAGSQAAPALASRVGSVHASETGDVAGVSCYNAPPLAQTCDVLSGAAALPWPLGLAVAGSTPLANASFQWGPYELQRWAAVGPGSPGGGSGCTVATALRPSSHPPLLLLLQVTISGCPTGGAPMNLTLALPAHLSSIPGVWSWGRPSPPTNPKAWNVTLTPAPGVGGGLLALSSDGTTATSASGVWVEGGGGGGGGGGTAVVWGVDPTLGAATLAVSWPLQDVGDLTVGLVLAAVSHSTGGGAGGAGAAAAAAAGAAAQDFPAAFAQAQSDWEGLWEAAFTPGNSMFSGSLPVLPPTSPLARPYYAGVVSLLQLLRNVSTGVWALPTAGPVWAVSDSYLWDSSTVGTLMALLEPLSWLRDTLGPLLTSGTHTHYARDYLSGEGVGPWYSFNDVSMFALLDKYGRATTTTTAAAVGGRGGEGGENLAFFNSSLAGRRVVEWMDEAATFWQGLVAPNSSLADYGLAYNLLECVPTYLHQVPSLNAANVAMMRRVGVIWGALGNTSRATYLDAAADALQPHVMDLYAGDGTWDCQYPGGGGHRINVRTVIDFIYTTDALGPYFPPSQRAAMLVFLQNELLVPGDVWLRALSLSDAAAPNSDRADHGPLGSYTGWPPMAALAVAQLGFVGEGVRLLAAFAGEGGVLSESCFGQAHRILVANFTSGEGVAVIKQGIAGGQDFFESVGGAFAEVALQLNAMQQGAGGGE